MQDSTCGDGASARQLLGRAQTHLDAKNPEAALAVLRDAVERFADDAELWNALGTALAIHGSRDEAARVWRNLGAAQHRLGNAGAAVEALKRSISLDTTAGTFEALAAVFEGVDDAEGARDARRHAALAARACFAAPLSLGDAQSPDFWRSVVPSLAIEGEPSPLAPALPDLENTVADLKHEGYVNIARVIPEARVARLRSCVEALSARGIPLPFAFVFDEMWALFADVAPFVEAVLGKGFRGLPAFWVWFVPPGDASSGWSPHRDGAKPGLDDDGTPHSITIWIPLTDATPLNGCICVLPAHHDDVYRRRAWDDPDRLTVHDPQKARALPATAGSLLAWNPGLLHWGSYSSRLAEGPRISASFEFQRADIPPIQRPLVDLERPPPFGTRLGLIGKQIIQYQHMYGLPEDLAAVAALLELRLV